MLTLVIMAAGMGSRYGGLKQMEGVGPNGETLLEYSLFDARRAGFEQVVFVIREDFAEAFQSQVVDKVAPFFDSVVCAFQSLDALPEGYSPKAERQKPWGTGHAVLTARGAVDGPFAVINADDFYGRSAFRALADFLTGAEEGRAALVSYRLENTLSEGGSVSRGICEREADGRLRGIAEHTKILEGESGIESLGVEGGPIALTGKEWVSMNLWGFTASFMGALEQRFVGFLEGHVDSLKTEFYLPFAVDEELQAGQLVVDCLTTESPWQGITYPEDRPRVVAALSQMVEAEDYPRALWAVL